MNPSFLCGFAAAIGTAADGIIGELVGMRIPEYEAKLYGGKIRGSNCHHIIRHYVERRRSVDPFVTRSDSVPITPFNVAFSRT